MTQPLTALTLARVTGAVMVVCAISLPLWGYHYAQVNASPAPFGIISGAVLAVLGVRMLRRPSATLLGVTLFLGGMLALTVLGMSAYGLATTKDAPLVYYLGFVQAMLLADVAALSWWARHQRRRENGEEPRA